MRSDGLASITVVIPTMNRSTLERTVRSAEGADQIVVVGDGCLPTAGDVRLQEHICATDREFRAAALRNSGMLQATSEWIAFMDDDDVFAPRAIDTIRAVVSNRQLALYIFKMRTPSGQLLWQRPVIEYCNVGTPMMVCPARNYKPWPVADNPAKYCQAPHANKAEDYGFARANEDTWPGGAVFRDEVIAHVRPG